ncbi:MAG: Fe-S cluster assembly protein SufD [Bacteroidetes bacterium]|nr:Fe-S cluster assembly protein SufD [Bacteroidota bacterium]MBK9047723.1 Fe-S cluster assembly protein SufD [Bacteroidota bacterium]
MIAEIKKEAVETFKRLGFPSTKNEEWKYVNVQQVLPDQPVFSAAPARLTAVDLKSFLIAGNNVHLLVFENGIYRADLSTSETINNLVIGPISLLKDNQTFKNNFGKVVSFGTEPFVALNTAVDHEGVFIHVPANTVIEKTIHILHVNTNEQPDRITSIRNLIVADKHTSISIVESYHSLNQQCNGLINAVNEIVVHENARVELCKAQLDSDAASQINFTQTIQEKSSTFDTVTVTLNGRLTRNNLHIKLNDTNCTSHLFGLYILDGDQITDNHTLVDHAMPNCYSNELYKGVIGGKASGVFNGKIFVRKDAQKTNAYQSNKNILLSDDATMNTKPQLEIFADDVKCTHGATTGQLDEEALFYLRARGIGEKSARTLLNIAFVADVLNNIKSDDLRATLQQKAEAKLMQ